jgi:hypothetical protein
VKVIYGYHHASRVAILLELVVYDPSLGTTGPPLVNVMVPLGGKGLKVTEKR